MSATKPRHAEKDASEQRITVKEIERFISVVNSYTGMLKNRTDYRRIQLLRKTIAEGWWEYVAWDERRLCVIARRGCRHTELLNKKWNLRLKEPPQNDGIQRKSRRKTTEY